MKILKINFLSYLSIVVLSSCATASYIGDKLVPTNSVDVYYSPKDVKKTYKVIGHISSVKGIRDEQAKQMIIAKAKTVGADAVIILGIDYTGGEDSSPYSKAEAIKYSNE